MSASSHPAPSPDHPVGRLLLASEGRDFTPGAIAAATASVASGGSVLVLSVARIWGTSLGLPNPWLLPSKHEWQTQREIVAKAVDALEAHGIAASGKVAGARNAAKVIVKEAKIGGYELVIMGSDANKSRLVGELFWTQEPQCVRRMSAIPVMLISDPVD